MNVQKAKGIVKKIFHCIGVFLFGVVSALLLGSRVRNHGIGADGDRGKQQNDSGKIDSIGTGIRESRDRIESSREGIRDATEAVADTDRILQQIRVRKKSTH